MRYIKINFLIESLRSSFWFLPTLISVGSALLALGVIYLDRQLIDFHFSNWLWVFDSGASGAREVVGTIAGSMITVAGVVFSITIVTLSLTSQQFGPRLLRNFLRDRSTQYVLGCFVGTFLYCLLILRSVRAEHESASAFVPNIGVALGVLFAVVAVFVLVFFIHHTANAIRAPTLVWNASKELIKVLERLYPDKKSQLDRPQIEITSTVCSQKVHAKSSGYIIGIDQNDLIRIENKCKIKLEIISLPGDFVVPGDDLVNVFGGVVDDTNLEIIISAFSTGLERSLSQDPRFGFIMLVEMAVRSVSPSMNDPYTAIQCIDRIREGLTFMIQRQPDIYMWPLPTFGDFLDECWEQLTFYGRDNPPVMKHLQKNLNIMRKIAQTPLDRQAIDRWSQPDR